MSISCFSSRVGKDAAAVEDANFKRKNQITILYSANHQLKLLKLVTLSSIIVSVKSILLTCFVCWGVQHLVHLSLHLLQLLCLFFHLLYPCLYGLQFLQYNFHYLLNAHSTVCICTPLINLRTVANPQSIVKCMEAVLFSYLTATTYFALCLKPRYTTYVRVY